MFYGIAGLKVSMNPKYEPLKSQVLPYLVTEEPVSLDCEIPQGEEVIERYKKPRPFLSFGDSEYLLYGAYFYDALLSHQGIMLHSSCVVYEGNAFLFSAPCGTGKSTHTGIWRKLFPASYILNDDKPAIRYEDGKLFVYGTPFSGKTNQNRNLRIPIAGISFLKRGIDNSIRDLDSKESLILFMGQTLKPYREERLDQMIEILDTIITQIPIYELTCNMEDEAAMLSYQTMKPSDRK